MFIGNLLGMFKTTDLTDAQMDEIAAKVDVVAAGGIISDPETGQHQIKKFKREGDGSLTIVYDETAEP